MALTVFSIVNDAYLPGFVALVNSVRRSGFLGPIRVGVERPLSKPLTGEQLFVDVLPPSPYALMNRKTEYLLAHPCEDFLFLDADIIITHPVFWQRLPDWLAFGPLFTLESLIAATDVRRYQWAQRLGLPYTANQATPLCYVNSGCFAGVWSREQALLTEWDRYTRTVLQPPGIFRTDPHFVLADQDTLNCLLQVWPQPFVTLQLPDWSSATTPEHPFSPYSVFDSHAPVVLHGTGPKPWHQRRVPLHEPRDYERAWYRYAIQEPFPLRVPIWLPRRVHWWFQQQLLGKLVMYGNRVWRRFV